MAFHHKTTDAARGKWRGILKSFGVPDSALSGKHGPCPVCEGTDRFRFDDSERRGTSFCTHCGARDGMQLAMAVTGRQFADIASEIDQLLGNITADTPRKELAKDDLATVMRRIWAESKPIEDGDLAHSYFLARGIELPYYDPRVLRLHLNLRDGDGGVGPCIVAKVATYAGDPKAITLHRTFLRPDGKAKAEMNAPRKIFPCELVDGACVAATGYGGTLSTMGIAEGIETAMAASLMFGNIPVWASINAGMMAKWEPPAHIDHLYIFGDNDANYTGQAAAYALARRMKMKKIEFVEVQIPSVIGQDWNDVLIEGKKK